MAKRGAEKVQAPSYTGKKKEKAKEETMKREKEYTWWDGWSVEEVLVGIAFVVWLIGIIWGR